jgi:hypothetical protein
MQNQSSKPASWWFDRPLSTGRRESVQSAFSFQKPVIQSKHKNLPSSGPTMPACRRLATHWSWGRQSDSYCLLV